MGEIGIAFEMAQRITFKKNGNNAQQEVPSEVGGRRIAFDIVAGAIYPVYIRVYTL